MNMLELHNISLNKGKFSLNNISFTIADNDYFALLGPTGSGKTLLLESIAGFQPVTGKILFKENNITTLTPEKRRFGFVFQDFALFPHMNVEKNIRYSEKFKENSVMTDNALKELLEFLQITHLLNRNTHNLSAGEKQRIAIARALYAQPRLLLLDEPLAALDPATCESILPKLAELPSRAGIAVIHVTHNFKTAERLANRTAIMLNGEISRIGDTDKVLSPSDNAEIAKFLLTNKSSSQNQPEPL
jgi:molybdate/tungstate transport system ATP-binding protein